jgi:hypothetical protein
MTLVTRDVVLEWWAGCPMHLAFVPNSEKIKAADSNVQLCNYNPESIHRKEP